MIKKAGRDKTVSMGRQIVIRIMLAIIAAFLILGAVTTSIAFDKLSQFAESSFQSVITGLSGSLEQLGISKSFHNGTLDQSSFDNLKSEVKKYKKNINMLSDSISLITQKDGEYVYVYGIEGNKEHNSNEKLVHTDNLLVKAYETGEAQISDFNISFIWEREPLDFYLPVQLSDNQSMVIHTTVKTDLIALVLTLVLAGFIGLLLIVLIIVNIIVNIVVRSQMRSVEVLVEKVEEISNLEGDLTKRIDIKSNNEIGLLANHVNNLLCTVHDMMLTIRESSEYLNKSTDTFQELMAATKETTSTLQSSVSKSKGAIERRSNAEGEVNRKVSQINEAVAQVTLRSEKVAAAAAKTTEEAVAGKDIMKDMKLYVHESVQKVSETGQQVAQLKEESAQINQIIDSIRSIAKQTNLLALNASIEAARAGEHGKGFSVVADEVRKLAEESSQQAASIEMLIQSIQQSIGKTQSSMESVLTTINNESNMVDKVDDRFTAITDSVSSVSEMVQEVYGTTEEISAFSESVMNEIQQMGIHFKQSDEVIEEMMVSISEQNNSVQGITGQVDTLSKIAGRLDRMIQKLKL